MFERFTPRARRVVVVAQDTARAMGHARIRPAHLLVGLSEGEGMAAIAMARVGVDPAALRQRVAALYESRPSAKEVDKVPFSPEAKRCLEQSLRAALGLGHGYIGTEHLFFGVEREAEASDRPVDTLLGVDVAEVHRRLTEVLGGASPPMRSPALQAALERAGARSGQSPMTTGHLLGAILADAGSQASRALAAVGVDEARAEAALDAVPVADTSDASPAPQSVAVTIGDTTTVVDDPEVASALQQLSAAELRDALKGAVDRPRPGSAAG